MFVLKYKTKLSRLSGIFFSALLVIQFVIFMVPVPALASQTDGTILNVGTNAGYAWSDVVGWVNFGIVAGNVHVTDLGLSGIALNADYGWINLAPANGGVTNNNNGVLGGYAWGAHLDWINFTGVTIDAQGRFHGAARGSLVGTLSFDCEKCNVSTDWRPALARNGGTSSSDGSILTEATTEAPMAPTKPSQELPPLFDVAASQVRTSSGNLVTRLAPGEQLPISVELKNFGGGQKVDVVISYTILNAAGVTVLTSTETVAVETTASFTKVIQIPQNFPPGNYTAQSSIEYLGQKVPAISSYQFTLERKVFGIFLTNFIVYVLVGLFIAIVFAVLSRLIIKKLRTSRIASHEYPAVPAPSRIFYELVSDTIMQMRYQIGNRALEIAKNINGLVINPNDGRVLDLKDKPAKIMASLISEYEKQVGEKISFAFQKHEQKTESTKPEVDKNLVVIRKRLAAN